MKILIEKTAIAINEALLSAIICARFMDGRRLPGIIMLMGMILLTELVLEKSGPGLSCER